MIKILRNEKFFYCCGCAKLSFDELGERPIDEGWDVSCVMNATELQARQKIIVPEKRIVRKEYFLEMIEQGAVEYVEELP